MRLYFERAAKQTHPLLKVLSHGSFYDHTHSIYGHFGRVNADELGKFKAHLGRNGFKSSSDGTYTHPNGFKIKIGPAKRSGAGPKSRLLSDPYHEVHGHALNRSGQPILEESAAGNKIPAKTIEEWRKKAAAFLKTKGYTIDDVKTGIDAWAVANHCEMTREGYRNHDANDAHIQTALEKIFPNAVFTDKKRY